MASGVKGAAIRPRLQPAPEEQARIRVQQETNIAAGAIELPLKLTRRAGRV